MIEPGFLALTTTPSMAPSCSELTTPVSAGSPCAQTVCEAACRNMTAAAAVRLATSLCCIVVSLAMTFLIDSYPDRNRPAFARHHVFAATDRAGAVVDGGTVWTSKGA